MTKVYLSTRGEYSDYRVAHVFTRREDAEAYKLGEDVEERELHDGPVEVRRWYVLRWHADRPDRPQPQSFSLSNPHTDSDVRDFDGDEKHAEHRWYENMLSVGGWDLALVKKVYSEQRAQYLARQEGVS